MSSFYEECGTRSLREEKKLWHRLWHSILSEDHPEFYKACADVSTWNDYAQRICGRKVALTNMEAVAAEIYVSEVGRESMFAEKLAEQVLAEPLDKDAEQKGKNLIQEVEAKSPVWFALTVGANPERIAIVTDSLMSLLEYVQELHYRIKDFSSFMVLRPKTDIKSVDELDEVCQDLRAFECVYSISEGKADAKEQQQPECYYRIKFWAKLQSLVNAYRTSKISVLKQDTETFRLFAVVSEMDHLHAQRQIFKHGFAFE